MIARLFLRRALRFKVQYHKSTCPDFLVLSCHYISSLQQVFIALSCAARAVETLSECTLMMAFFFV